ncbi:MAG: SpoIIE family protein phosphatase, partial [Rhodothermales bacterium]
DFKLRNESVELGAESPLEEHISSASSITLSHAENDLAFDYVGLHYATPEHNTYAYMLEGFDADWRWVGEQRNAIYTNIPPGPYVFKVKAANSDGVWTEEGASIRLTVRPPWWKTYWAYAFYILGLIGVVVAADRIQRQRVVGQERARAEIREAQLQAQAAEAQALLLRTENERQMQELEEARQLQLSMLPRAVPQHPVVEIAAYMKTATEVGGDYYDFNVADDGTLTVAIGDATGHGANAGTMVTATKSIFNVLAAEPDLIAVLEQSTRALKQMGLRKLYMALALAKLNDHTLELAGAGMPPALIYRGASQHVEEISLKGMPLGSFVDFPYQKAALQLAPGDTVILMSDGFPEMFDMDGEMFGYDRTKAVFEEVAHRSPDEIVMHFAEAGKTWANGSARDDDMTFIVMKVKHVK